MTRKAVDSPIIALFEDRPKQGMVYQLNFSIYLDARVRLCTSMKDLKRHLAAPDGVHLVVARAQFKGAPILGKLCEFLEKNGAKVPVLCLGDEKERPGVQIIGNDTDVRAMLQAASRELGITARSMVSKEREKTYDIQPDFFNLLFTIPCEVFDRGDKGLTKIFNAGDVVARAKVAAFVRDQRPLVIESLQRLKLVNAVTEQTLKAADDLTAVPGPPDEKKMAILSASLDMVAAQFQNSGMDEETVKLANASIKAVEAIANSAGSVGNLVKQLLDSQGGYRYAHCQLVTFLGFHVIKMMGWWGEDQRNILSQAAFYHDISLTTDEQAQIRTMKALEASGLKAKDPAQEELVLTHPQLAARELQTSPDVSPEVVRLVIQHHGSPTGKGFSAEIAKLDNLTKTFVMSEEWADYLIHIAETNAKPDNAGRIRELKAQYPDELCQQIVETFRYLDPAEFQNDFLAATEVDDFAASLIGGSSAGDEAQSVVVLPAGGPEEEASQKLEGVTDVRNDEQIVVKGQAEETPEEKVTRVRAESSQKARESLAALKKQKPDLSAEEQAKVLQAAGLPPEDVAQVLQGGETEAEKFTRLRAEKRAADPGRKVSGVTDVRNDEEILVKAEPEETPEEKQTRVRAENSQKARNALQMLKQKKPDLSAEDQARMLKAAGLPPEDVEQVLKGGETEAETSTRLRAEKRAAERSTKVKGVTDHRLDEKIVVKGDPSQNYVDNSLKVIKADPKEKERELKMKALAGSTEAMKAALSGQVDVLTTILTASAGELKKTDAEGRTAIHYAAMGGSAAALKFLIEKGAGLNTADSKRRSPLFFAALYKHNEAFDYLLAQGAKINQQAMGGMTIAMIGAFSGNMHILKTAVQKGVKLDVKDHSGKTALDLAKGANQAEAIAFIEETLAAAKAPPAKAA